MPHHFRRIAHLEAFLEEAAEIPRKFFKTGRFLPRGGILLRLHKEYATQRDTIPLPDILVAKRIRNPAEDAKRSVIVYRVPLWFELENIEDFFGEELACYRQFTKKGTSEETETLELKFYTIEDATKYIQAQKIYVSNQAFRTAPKIVAPLKICRVCKTINPEHRPGSCTSIPCGKCSEDHATEDHPESVTRLKCPVCSEEHSFNRCPHRQMASKKALKTAQKSYK